MDKESESERETLKESAVQSRKEEKWVTVNKSTVYIRTTPRHVLLASVIIITMKRMECRRGVQARNTVGGKGSGQNHLMGAQYFGSRHEHALLGSGFRLKTFYQFNHLAGMPWPISPFQ